MAITILSPKNNSTTNYLRIFGVKQVHVDSQGKWEVSISSDSLSSGYYSIMATDGTDIHSINIKFDKTQPASPTLYVYRESPTQIIVYGLSEPGSKIVLSDGEFLYALEKPVEESGMFRFYYTLTKPLVKISAQAQDPTGNTSELGDSITLMLDDYLDTYEPIYDIFPIHRMYHKGALNSDKTNDLFGSMQNTMDTMNEAMDFSRALSNITNNEIDATMTHVAYQFNQFDFAFDQEILCNNVFANIEQEITALISLDLDFSPEIISAPIKNIYLLLYLRSELETPTTLDLNIISGGTIRKKITIETNNSYQHKAIDITNLVIGNLLGSSDFSILLQPVTGSANICSGDQLKPRLLINYLAM